MRLIRSADNEAFRQVAALAASSHERRRSGLTLLEGLHLCESWIERRGAPSQVLVQSGSETDGRIAPLLERARALGAPAIALAPSLFGRISQVVHGVPLMFVIEVPRASLPRRWADEAIYLDRVQDPGNVGTLLRLAVAVGVPRLITAPGSASLWSPKVLRSAMGAHFSIELHESVGWDELLGRFDGPLRLTAADAAESIYEADLAVPGVWCFGNEGAGVAPPAAAGSTQALSIPQREGVESLNVALAAAVCLYEQFRQRLR